MWFDTLTISFPQYVNHFRPTCSSCSYSTFLIRFLNMDFLNTINYTFFTAAQMFLWWYVLIHTWHSHNGHPQYSVVTIKIWKKVIAKKIAQTLARLRLASKKIKLLHVPVSNILHNFLGTVKKVSTTQKNLILLGNMTIRNHLGKDSSAKNHQFYS